MAKKEKDIRFKKFGVVSFTETTKVNDFIDYLEKDQLMYSCCNSCGEKYFPPRADCAACLASDMSWNPVQDQGTLVSFSRLKYAPAGFESEAPYTIALVDFDDCRVFGRLDKSYEDTALKIGMKVTVKVQSAADGQLTYSFIPA